MTPNIAYYLVPEIILTVAALAIYVLGAFIHAPRIWRWVALSAVAAAAAQFLLQRPLDAVAPFVADSLAGFLRGLVLAAAAVLVLLNFGESEKGSSPEKLGSLLLVMTGASIVAGANELILIFVGLELVSIPTYILLYLGRKDALGQESAVKYFFLSLLASAMFLYGASFFYGLTGTTRLDLAEKILAASAVPAGFDGFAKAALALLFAGLCFRLAAVPFHFYAPDVYQGTSQANAALLSVAPKIVGLAALTRIVWFAMPGYENYVWIIAFALAVLTMTLGNALALLQSNFRRLMAYSAIAHAGYLLVAFAAASATVALDPSSKGAPGLWDGLSAAWFYTVVYSLATLGCFAVVEFLRRENEPVNDIEELAGLAKNRPVAAGILAFCLLSLAGIPPLAGFWGKLYVFGAALNVGAGLDGGTAVRPWFVGLAVVGVLNAAVAAAYYLRIIAVAFFRDPTEKSRGVGELGPWAAAAVCSVGVLIFSLFPGSLMGRANEARPAKAAVAVSSLHPFSRNP